MLLFLLMRLEAQAVLLGHLLERLHLGLESVELLHLLLFDLRCFDLFLLELAKSFVQIRQAASTIIDLLDGVRLIVLLRQLVEAILSLRLVGVEVFPNLVLASDLGLSIFQLLLEVDQVVWITDFLEPSLQFSVLAHQVRHCFVSVGDLLLGGFDAQGGRLLRGAVRARTVLAANLRA